MRSFTMFSVGLAACVPSSGSFQIPDGGTLEPFSSPLEPTDDPPPEDTAVLPTDSGTPTVGATGDTGAPDPCLEVPIAPLGYEWLSGPRPSEEFVFTADGWMVNLPDGMAAVFRTAFGVDPELVAPYEAVEVAGIRMLLDGDLAIANEWDGSVDRLNLTTGARTMIAGGLDSPNSLAVGPDGRLYIANYGQVIRLDPAVPGDIEILATLPDSDLDGLTFSPDYRRLYVNHDEGGEIGVVDLATDGTASPIAPFGQIPVSPFAQLDGMATDACGNLYAVRTDGQLWRVTPDGAASLYAESTSQNAFTTSVSFGSGIGGWERDHLYMMDRNSTILDIDVGVEGRPEPHLP